jgi:hypothetical protein
LTCSAFLDGFDAPSSVVLGRGNLLEVYGMSDSAQCTGAIEGGDEEGNNGDRALRLRASFPLAGTLVGLETATVAGNARAPPIVAHRSVTDSKLSTDVALTSADSCSAVDLLVLTFAPAKVSS